VEHGDEGVRGARDRRPVNRRFGERSENSGNIGYTMARPRASPDQSRIYQQQPADQVEIGGVAATRLGGDALLMVCPPRMETPQSARDDNIG
jgi:hypothetical protein